MQQTKVSLKNLANGQVIERFDLELAKAIKNIRDINTSWKKARKISLTVNIHPNEDRNLGGVDILCVSTLAPVKELQTTFYMGESGEETIAFESNPAQQSFNFEEKETDNIVKMKGVNNA